MAVTGSTMAATDGLASPWVGVAFVEGLISFGYGIVEVGNGLIGGQTMPSSHNISLIYITGGKVGAFGFGDDK
jgi:hypothetical protein